MKEEPCYPKKGKLPATSFSAKVNYLAHVGVGKLQRMGLIALPLLSLVLSTIAGSAVLTGNSLATGYLSLAASAITGVVLYLANLANWRGHLRVGSDYEALYQDALGYDMRNETNENCLAQIGKQFRDLTQEASRLEVQLSPRQIRRYVDRARNDLPESISNANPELLD